MRTQPGLFDSTYDYITGKVPLGAGAISGRTVEREASVSLCLASRCLWGRDTAFVGRV
jgi:hypothetical protein